MATITLYSGKINQMSSLINKAKTSVKSYSKTVIPILNPYSYKSKSLSDIIPFSHRCCVILQAVFLNIRTYAVS